MRCFEKSGAKAFTRYVILLLAIASCVYGFVNGEADAVLRKAAEICMECCGIG